MLTRTSFSSTVTNTTTGTIYKSATESQYDDFGEVYYFAGNQPIIGSNLELTVADGHCIGELYELMEMEV